MLIFEQVKELQRKALIYEASPTLDLHDLYKEFTQSLVMKEGIRERDLLSCADRI